MPDPKQNQIKAPAADTGRRTTGARHRKPVTRDSARARHAAAPGTAARTRPLRSGQRPGRGAA